MNKKTMFVLEMMPNKSHCRRASTVIFIKYNSPQNLTGYLILLLDKRFETWWTSGICDYAKTRAEFVCC
jgi:hypothetical protein